MQHFVFACYPHSLAAKKSSMQQSRHIFPCYQRVIYEIAEKTQLVTLFVCTASQTFH